MRKLVTIALVAGLAVSLAACTSNGGSSTASRTTDGCTAVADGAASKAVSVSGAFGTTPKVTIKAPVKAGKTTQRTVVKRGSGKVVKSGDQINVDYTVYNGTTGKAAASTGFDGQPVPFTLDSTQALPGFLKTFQCSTVGTRVVGVIPASEGAAVAQSLPTGFTAKTPMVIVADVVAFTPKPLKTAKGTAVAPKSGFPKVVFDSKGEPTVTIPKTAQPSKFEVETLIKGTGKKVGHDVNVTVNYQLVNWRTGKVVSGNDTYSTGSPATFNTGQVVAGFQKALEGQPVGSRVLMVVPPADGYGKTGQPSAGIKGTDDLVFVVDILGVS